MHITAQKGERITNQEPFGAVIVTIILWSSAFAGIRVGLSGYNPYQLTLLRFGVASTAFMMYAIFMRLPIPKGKDLPHIILAGLFGITAYHLALNIGEQTVPAAAASLIIATTPIFTALLSGIFLQEKLSKNQWMGMMLSLAGVILLVVGSGESIHFGRGALFVLMAAICGATFFVLQKPLLTSYSPLHLAAYCTWAGTLPLLFAAPSTAKAMLIAPWPATVAAIYIGLFPAALAYVTWGMALAALPAGRAASYLYLNPPLAAFIAMIWIGEVPTWSVLAGGIVVLAGVIMVNNHRSRSAALKSPTASLPPAEQHEPANTSN